MIPGWARSPGGGNGNPLQYSCLGNPKDRGAWQATVHGVTKIWTRLSTRHDNELSGVNPSQGDTGHVSHASSAQTTDRLKRGN